MTATLRSMSAAASRTCWIAGDVAREGGDDDPALERLHDLAERLADGPLGRRVARVLGARRVGQEAERRPPAPSRARIAKSDSLPSTGVWSNLKSPVWTIVPTGVRRAMPIASGIEWPTRNGMTVNGPISISSPGSSAMQRVVVELVLLDLVAEQAARQRARRRPGTPGNSGRTYGSPPTWSSWAWVMRNALTLARCSLR